MLELMYRKLVGRKYTLKNKFRLHDLQKTDLIAKDKFFLVVNMFYPMTDAEETLMDKHFFKGGEKVNYLDYLSGMSRYMEESSREGHTQKLLAKGAGRQK